MSELRELMEAYEQLAYAYQSSIHSFTKESMVHINTAMDIISTSDLSEEQKKYLLSPLKEIQPFSLPTPGISSRIDIALKELLSIITNNCSCKGK